MMAFSIYTHLQYEHLKYLGQSIKIDLDNCFGSAGIQAELYMRAYGNFWLWTLGAYEIARTMKQNCSCFSERYQRCIIEAHSYVVDIRMAFAKQELRGRRGPIYNELSIKKHDTVKKDFAFTFSDKKIVYVRKTVDAWEEAIGSLDVSDVVRSIPSRDGKSAPETGGNA